MEDLQKLPEWKQLYEAIMPLIEAKKMFSYAELSALANINIQSSRGRAQFLRFRREALKDWLVWF